MSAVFFHGPAENAFEIRGELGIEMTRRDRFLVQDRVQRSDHVAGGKGLLAGRHFVKHDSEREQIAPRVQFFAARLLRRHINRCSRNHAHRRQRVFHGGIARSRIARRLGQSEIEDLGLTALPNKNIGRLDVAMNDPLGVRSRQSIGHLDANVEEFVDFDRLFPNPLLQAHSLQLLHDDERMSAVVVDVVDGADAGMVQLGSGACFAHEAVERLAVVHHLRRNELERDVAGQARVFRLIHHAHAATTELSHDLIVGDRLADHSEGLSAIGGYVRPLAKSGQPASGTCLLKPPPRFADSSRRISGYTGQPIASSVQAASWSYDGGSRVSWLLPAREA